jgi:DNA-directed RNA polymerase specialized sigma24 family protein
VSPESFDQLMARVRQGEESAAREFCWHYFPRLLGKVRKRLSPRLRAENGTLVADSVIESLVGHFTRRDSDFDLSNADDPWSLLARVALRHCSKHNKRAERHLERHGPPRPIGVGEGSGFQVEDRGLPPEAVVEYADFLDCLLRKLTPQQGDILRYKLDEKQTKEIAATLDVAPRTVEREWQKIRERLQEEIARLGNG